MPKVTVLIPNIEVDLDVPADFAAYVTLEDLREMAEGILSVRHTGIGIDTVCAIRRGEKNHEWTEAFVNLDEDEKINIRIEDDGFAALEKQIADTTTGSLTLTASYRKLGQDEELMSIMDSKCPDAKAEPAMKLFIRNLDAWWMSAKP
jgi:hypothetical protein